MLSDAERKYFTRSFKLKLNHRTPIFYRLLRIQLNETDPTTLEPEASLSIMFIIDHGCMTSDNICSKVLRSSKLIHGKNPVSYASTLEYLTKP
jgi:hypothetical protein